MIKNKVYIFGAIFYLSTKIQNLGDKIFTEITTKQWFLLISIVRSGVKNPTLTQVAKILGYSRQNVKKLSIHLEDVGLLRLKRDETDSRIVRIILTKKCLEYFESRQEKEEEFIENLYKGITDEELSKVSNIIKKLEKNISYLEALGDS
ncbi:MarR family winged helix-turn-helix transcriptional regulator [Clostridium botulinum]|uniref:MarR family winged helix-turn-helix transcriptional regulator n=1 Tax=Clostridium botulinum TaxID=1491 RepID=UPI001E4C01C4|nr:winged helix DNA-binding protein [Clostridium botulinum]MCC5437462.1 winged helix DNA-binding protein [Clostridium botulinum]NFR57433.1 MarR family transcriptional regulator [Clostridium botulinum]